MVTSYQSNAVMSTWVGFLSHRMNIQVQVQIDVNMYVGKKIVMIVWMFQWVFRLFVCFFKYVNVSVFWQTFED